jgi:hypothetical protein
MCTHFVISHVAISLPADIASVCQQPLFVGCATASECASDVHQIHQERARGSLRYASVLQVAKSQPQLVQSVVLHIAQLLAARAKLPTSKLVELPAIVVGMQAKTDELVQQLGAGSTSMALLTGMAGIGKTVLAKSLFDRLHTKNPTVPCHFVRLSPGMEDPNEFVPEQRELLRALAGVEDASGLHSAEAMRRVLAEKVAGKKVLVVVDNAWGGQLQLLLPREFMEVLGPGSAVLVTSRDAHACDAFGKSGILVEMECLPEPASLELFCWHAYDASSVPAEEKRWERKIDEVLARCGGLPMAVEVAATHFRCSRKQDFFRNVDSALSFALQTEEADKMEAERTVFGALRLSWDALAAEEQDALLDIVWFLQGQPWGLVQRYCQYGVLDRLHKLAFVKQVVKAGQPPHVAVAVVLVAFCKEAAKQRQEQRLELVGGSNLAASIQTRVCHPVSAASEMVLIDSGCIRMLFSYTCLQDGNMASTCPWNTASPDLRIALRASVQVGTARGLSLSAGALDDLAAGVAQQAALQLLLAKSTTWPNNLLLSRLPSLRWLGLEGTGHLGLERLELQARDPFCGLLNPLRVHRSCTLIRRSGDYFQVSLCLREPLSLP